MPETNFMNLTRMIRQECHALKVKVSSRRVEQIAGHAMRSEEFKQAIAQIDREDAAQGLIDLDQHSDTTARVAIQRVLRELFNLAWDESQAVAA